ncbi:MULTISPECIES: hypothetical protein [unclassified Streptomyces]|uniref:hypothetical protein n=1 Tax=unclassified Streptomyces TaxID=2593676 RepID=UPI0033A4A8ED
MSTHDRKARLARVRLAGIAVLAVGVLAAGGYLAVNTLAGDSTGPGKGSAADQPSTPSSPAPTGEGSRMTPGKAKAVTLLKSTRSQNGAPVGFPKNGMGALSAAVAYWEEYAWLDDVMARRQLQALVSPDSPQTIDKQISEVRRLREGVGLPPSGPAPAGVTFSTVVEAVRGKSLTQDGSVVQIWLEYDRYATKPEGGGDDDPLKDQSIDVILKWQQNQWRITEEPQYVKLRTFPVSYDPASVPARKDGWLRVAHAD